ncbi:MAG: adenosylcobinamide amidohydrolase [Cognaticolwellia sp.]|jgi:adenosylcobinamide amidohydrolase
MRVERDGPWLDVHFEQPQHVLSWAIVGGGLGTGQRIAWRKVSDGDVAGDVVAWTQRQAAERGIDGPVMLTAASLDRLSRAECSVGGITARALVTVGLNNRLAVGDPPGPGPVGTINLLVHVDVPLSVAALLEALSIAVQARTAAVIDAGLPSVVSGKQATGTGTDCVVLVCPMQGDEQVYSGMHTALGSAIGQAVRSACDTGVREWVDVVYSR